MLQLAIVFKQCIRIVFLLGTNLPDRFLRAMSIAYSDFVVEHFAITQSQSIGIWVERGDVGSRVGANVFGKWAGSVGFGLLLKAISIKCATCLLLAGTC